uniref:Osiris 19 n=1 Tax=Triatoma infestans TaxID=30076 RepID=A0A161MQD1_TRIIF
MEEGRRRKSKLRKLLIPLMVFVLLKAMTLIPLALGVLGLKAWNALQLSFFSFVTSLALAIFNLVKKMASDSAVPVAHTFAEPYHYAARNLVLPSSEDAQELAFSAYQQQ